MAQETSPVLSVSSLNRSIKTIIEGQFHLIWVKGEISNFKAHSSGHFYFSLKDERSQISSVMFRGYNARLNFKPKDGIEVIARARVTVYEPRGNYQIVCESLERVGEGGLQEAFEKLKNKLKEEGLFSVERKKVLPPWPRHIVVVTSPTGAAIRDMIHVLNRRNKGLRLTVIPSLVQGEQAASELIRGVEQAHKIPDVDVLILARGGGSIEDLWCFNDEKLARVISQSSIPTISAVGHEIDFTISDFVADLRAPTPSAAAEVVIKSEIELEEKLLSLRKTLFKTMEYSLVDKKQRLKILLKSLIDPRKRLEDLAIRCDDIEQRLFFATENMLKEKKYRISLMEEKLISPRFLLQKMKSRLENLEKRLSMIIKDKMHYERQVLEKYNSLLDSLSPLRVVDRGYSLVTNISGKVIKSSEQVSEGESIDIRVSKGRIIAEVKKIKL